MYVFKFAKKTVLLTLFILGMHEMQAQDLYKAKSTKVDFFSEAPLENISAVNTGCASLINTKTREVAVVVPIKLFEFEKDLMREHFNENYMESDKYKNASFKGKINEEVDFTKEGTYELSATGAFNIHGVEKQRTLKGTMKVTKKGLELDAKFMVKLEDHDIEIPKIVFEKIAEEVEVTCNFVYEAQ